MKRRTVFKLMAGVALYIPASHLDFGVPKRALVVPEPAEIITDSCDPTELASGRDVILALASAQAGQTLMTDLDGVFDWLRSDVEAEKRWRAQTPTDLYIRSQWDETLEPVTVENVTFYFNEQSRARHA